MSTLRAPNKCLAYLLRAHLRTVGRHDELQDFIGGLAGGDRFTTFQWAVGLDYFRRRLAALTCDRGVLLDLGSGSGNWAVAGGLLFREVVAFDFDERRLRIGRQIARHLGQQNVRFVSADIRSVPLRDGSASLILAYNVLPNAPNWRSAIAEIRRLLKPEGFALLGWADCGMSVYVALEGLMAGNPSRFAQGPWMLVRKLFGVKRNRKAPYWLSAGEVERAALDADLSVVWRSWADPQTPSPAPLLPKRFAGLPFFNEMVVQHRSAGTVTERECPHKLRG